MYLVTYLVAEGNTYAGGDVPYLALVSQLCDADKYSRIIQVQQVTVGDDVPLARVTDEIESFKHEKAQRAKLQEIAEVESRLQKLRASL